MPLQTYWCLVSAWRVLLSGYILLRNQLKIKKADPNFLNRNSKRNAPQGKVSTNSLPLIIKKWNQARTH